MELAVHGSTIWAIADTDVARLDTATNKVQVLNMGSTDELDNIAASSTAIWVADFDADMVLRLDPATGNVTDRIIVGAAEDLLPVGNAIWVTNHHEGSITRIDPTTDKPIDTIVIGTPGSGGPQQLAEAGDSVWVDESNTSQVIRMNAQTGSVVAKISVPSDFGDCGGILPTADAVWVTGCHETADVIRIDPVTNTVVARIGLDGYTQDLFAVGDHIWAPVPSGLDRIDPATNRVDATIPMPDLIDSFGVVFSGKNVWLANAGNAILRVPISALATP